MSIPLHFMPLRPAQYDDLSLWTVFVLGVWGDFMYRKCICMSVSVCLYSMWQSIVKYRAKHVRAGTSPEAHYSRFSRFSKMNFKGLFLDSLDLAYPQTEREIFKKRKKKYVPVYWLLQSMKINGAYEKQQTIIFLKCFHKQKQLGLTEKIKIKSRLQFSQSGLLSFPNAFRCSYCPLLANTGTQCLLSFMGCASLLT